MSIDRNPLKWPVFLYGGDYNPDQWPREVWDEDMALMRRVGWNVASLPIFGWAALEPEEGIFDFEWLDDILDRMHAAGVYACLATATASVPAWLTQKYPDVLVVHENDVRAKHGNRHTFCPNSPNFRRLSTRLAQKIAERYVNHPALLLWHVSNEYGTYCYCSQCGEAFRLWLQKRYGTIEELNSRWYTSFWGHTFTDWSQIDTPTFNGERSIQALRIDYNRFQSESLLNCYRAEADVLREIAPGVPITTNLMGAFFPLDYHDWAKHLDVVSWDNYPQRKTPPSETAFFHSLMRGLKCGQPFLLLEQSPSQQNWQPYSTVKRPGRLRLQSYQAVAHGADSVMYFQWRRGRGGIEKLHGAVVEHGGTPENRVFKDVEALGAELAKLGTQIQGHRVPAKVAMLFSWPNQWTIRFSSGPSADLNAVQIAQEFFGALHSLGIQVEILSPEADLSGYDVIVAPVLNMLPEKTGARIAKYVEQGATLVTTFISGQVDETDRFHLNGAPGPWREVLGIFAEETEALEPDEANGIEWNSGESHRSRLLCDRVRLEGAEAIATYTDDFYAGEPAVTRNAYGAGVAYYVATMPDADGLRHLVDLVCDEKGIGSPLANGQEPPVGVEVTVRGPHLYLLNHTAEWSQVDLADGQYEDLLSGETLTSSAPLEPLGVRILAKST